MALLLKRTLLRGETPVFVMEMPLYKVPSPRLVLRRMFDSGWAFLRRAGTLILASMVVVWALLYFPRGETDGQPYDVRVAQLRKELDRSRKKAGPRTRSRRRRQEINALTAEWKQQSYLGRMGKAIEPVVRPLGWDWKIGMAALASFPAREGRDRHARHHLQRGQTGQREHPRGGRTSPSSPLAIGMKEATWDGDPSRPVFTIPTVLSLLVFFALCCQCASTLVVIQPRDAQLGAGQCSRSRI